MRNELHLIFAAPALIWQFLFLYLPLFILLFYSFVDFSQVRFFLKFTISSYYTVTNSLYFRVILNSFFIAIITSIICFFVSYPVAYYFSMKLKRFKTLLLFSLILPSWTSFIVQVYAWFFLLKKQGIISFILEKLGIISANTHLLNNNFSIIVGMVYCFLPFMILPIYAVLEKMDKSLIEASSDLGANKLQTFKRIIFPISFPGVASGFLLVFIPAFGEFAIPDLLGGGKKLFWGTVIVEKFLVSRNWSEGSAFTLVGILFLIIAFLFVYGLTRLFQKILIIRNTNKLPHF